jgi:hypothetical protein
VSFWADPKNTWDTWPCTHATAQAILKSGLPYPRFTYEEVQKPNGSKEQHRKTVDVWVGSTRYVLPAQLVVDNSMYWTNHPARFWKLEGSLPNFYPPGPRGPVIDGMGSMVQVTIQCSVDPAYIASWGKGYKSNQDGIQKVKEKYEEDLRIDSRYPGTVTVSVRDDLGMTEVLLDRKQEADGRRWWEASYWPLKGDLRSPDGAVSGIRCAIRHDPEKRYGKMGWRCSSSIALTPEATATIEIYVSQIANMPAIYEQVKRLFADARR